MNNIKKIIKNIIPWMEQSEKIYRIYKKSNNLIKKNNKFLAYYYMNKMYKKYGCTISPKAEIGKNLKLPHPGGIVIGAESKIGDNVIIYQNVTLGRKKGEVLGCPIIENNVTIYCNSVLIGNITIGENTVIGCNSTVLKSVEANSKCVGVVK